jgi:hypothetical protein
MRPHPQATEPVATCHVSRLHARAVAAIKEGVLDSSPVAGLTHQFYRYPARFSPTFARAAIEAFTNPGDLVLDPFVGGGTTLVEARVLGRLAVGADISHLARFVSQVKTTPLTVADTRALREWVQNIQPLLSVRSPTSRNEDPAPANLDLKNTWRLRKLLALTVELARSLQPVRRQAFARCVVLRTAQWALDGRRHVPTLPEFRSELRRNMESMLAGMEDFVAAAQKAERHHRDPGRRSWCLVARATELDRHPIWKRVPQPRLILTSPPYAGIHVVYDRWQIAGRKETSAPFWITDSQDGHHTSYYTFGDRRNEPKYFAHARAVFTRLAQVAGPDTIMVQLVGFSQPHRQLPAYLDLLEEAGFREVDLGQSDRVWRQVPNRKWHANQKGETASSKEVVLVHKPQR